MTKLACSIRMNTMIVILELDKEVVSVQVMIAWQQGGVLTMLDLELLLNLNGAALRKFSKIYQEYYELLLLKEGIMLGMGRMLTYKKIVFEMSLNDLRIQQIA